MLTDEQMSSDPIPALLWRMTRAWWSRRTAADKLADTVSLVWLATMIAALIVCLAAGGGR